MALPLLLMQMASGVAVVPPVVVVSAPPASVGGGRPMRRPPPGTVYLPRVVRSPVLHFSVEVAMAVRGSVVRAAPPEQAAPAYAPVLVVALPIHFEVVVELEVEGEVEFTEDDAVLEVLLAGLLGTI